MTESGCVLTRSKVLSSGEQTKTVNMGCSAAKTLHGLNEGLTFYKIHTIILIMIIKFKKEMTLEIVTNFNSFTLSRGDTESEMCSAWQMRKGEELDIDICDGLNPPDSREIQLADGSVSFVTPDFWQDVEVVKE